MSSSGTLIGGAAVRIFAVEIIPDKRKVVGLVEQAHEGKICLPNFQRDFVWTREEVADLVTIDRPRLLHRFPASSPL